MAVLDNGLKWTFAKLQGNELGQGAQNAIISHFSKSPYSSLIRESIQNSLDASDDSGNPVVVEYSFSRISASDYPNFFRLREHIRGISKSFPHNVDAIQMARRMDDTFQQHANSQRIPYIKVSDYNTTGMRYRPKGMGKSPFSSFLRIAGDSLKNNAGAGGSFGFGKAAYFNISPIRTVLVATLTDTDEFYFEGGAMLTDHYFENIERTYFGFYDDQDGYRPTSNILSVPTRFRREQKGTDFYIMGVNTSEEEKQEAIKEMAIAVLRNFWLAILHNKLTVRIEDKEISSANICEMMSEYFYDDRDDKNRSETYNPRPYFDAVRNANTSSSYVHIHKEIPIVGEVSLYVKKVRDAKDKVAYMRSPRMLVFSKQFQTSYGCYCLFFCDNPTGNELLGKLENAAHREWEPANYKNDIKTGAEAVKSINSFISTSLEELFASNTDSPLGISGLEEFLYLEDDMIPTESEDIKDNPFFGLPTGDSALQGTSMTSIISEDKTKRIDVVAEKKGSVVTHRITTASTNEKGELGGNSNHPATDRRNHRPSPGDKRKMESEDGTEGTYNEVVSVKYRVIALRNPQGKMLHTIIINAPYDIEDGMIELLVAGEQDCEALDIAYSDKGDFNDNQVFGLQFHAGKNDVTIHFDDSMKHPIILKAYEFK